MVGQINAGSSAALVNATGLSLALLAQIQAEKTQTEKLEADAQGALTKAAFDSTIKAGHKDAMNSYLAAAGSFVQAGAGVCELRAATSATDEITQSAHVRGTAMGHLSDLEDSLNAPVHAAVQGGAVAANDGHATVNDMDNFKAGIANPGSLTPEQVTSLKGKTYTPDQKKELQTKIDAQRKEVEFNWKKSENSSSYTNTKSQAKIKMASSLGQATTQILQGLTANEKAAVTANAEVQRSAAQQIGKSVDTTDQDRASTFQMMAKLIDAETQAVGANNLRG